MLKVAVIILVVAFVIILLPPRFEGKATASESLLFRYETISYQAEGEIIEPPTDGSLPLGINSDTDVLGFGIILTGDSSSRKYLTIPNDRDSPIKVRLAAEGTIAPLLTFGANNFILGPGERREVTVDLASGQADPGVYTGTVLVTAILPKHPIAAGLLSLV